MAHPHKNRPRKGRRKIGSKKRRARRLNRKRQYMGSYSPLDMEQLPCYTLHMVQFMGEPLDLNIGDIVIERQIGDDPEDIVVAEYIWVVYKIVKSGSYHLSSAYEKGYCAFMLSDYHNTIGPIVFRNTDTRRYEVIRYG